MYLIETLKYRNASLFYFGLICLVLALLFSLFAKWSNIQVAGVNAWLKPLKFSVSIMLYSWSMAWYCFYLPAFNITMFNWTIIILLGFEIIYIAFQAGRGQPSHYNFSTSLYAILFQLMGLAAALVTIYTGYIGYLFFQSQLPNLPLPYVWGIRMGIIIFVIFSFEGALMGARLSHSVGGEDGQGTMLLHWNKKFGDLRIAHFIGMHALQILPWLSFYVLKTTKSILIASVFYALLALYALIQALSGKSFQNF